MAASVALTPPGEFRAVLRSYPRLLINVLAVVSVAYGLILTGILPWIMMKAVLDEEMGIVPSGPVGVLWGICLILIGTLIMARWIVVQALALWEHNQVRSRPPKEIGPDAPF